MFDYVNRMQLALGDKARRAGLKAAAGVALLIGAGFLLAALWSWLAWRMQLGPATASLIIGAVFALVGLVILLISAKERHAVPTAEELRDEVQATLGLAADAAIDKVKFQAESAVEGAKAKVSSLFGGAGGTVMSAAHGAGDLAAGAGRKVAEAAEFGGEALHDARETLDRAMETRSGPAIGLAGAFSIGVILASLISQSRSKDDFYYDDEDDWDEDYD